MPYFSTHMCLLHLYEKRWTKVIIFKSWSRKAETRSSSSLGFIHTLSVFLSAFVISPSCVGFLQLAKRQSTLLGKVSWLNRSGVFFQGMLNDSSFQIRVLCNLRFCRILLWNIKFLLKLVYYAFLLVADFAFNDWVFFSRSKVGFTYWVRGSVCFV